MLLPSFVRYLFHRVRFPDAAIALREGFGIEQRAARCAWFWRNHLEQTRGCIQRTLQRVQPQSVTVIGAGRLFDFPLEALAPPTTTIRFIDIDPSCIRSWSSARALLESRGLAVQGEILDVTARTQLLQRTLATLAVTEPTKLSTAIEQALESVQRAPLPETLRGGSADLVISLNIMSQLGIGIQRVVQRSLRARSWSGTQEQLEGVTRKTAELIFQVEYEHLELLRSWSNRHALLICDTEFIDYWPHESDWKVTPALELPPPLGIPGMRTIAQRSWYWHLAPYGLEYRDHGEIHRVEALLAERESLHA